MRLISLYHGDSVSVDYDYNHIWYGDIDINETVAAIEPLKFDTRYSEFRFDIISDRLHLNRYIELDFREGAYGVG